MNSPFPVAAVAALAEAGAHDPAALPATRLHQLFRASLRDGRVHPLLRLMQQRDKPAYAAEPQPLPAPLAAAAAAPERLSADAVRQRVAELPPLPKAALRALETLRRDDASLEDIAADIGVDASLTARVLRLANSPFYGVPGRVASARSAAQVLGRRTLESVLSLAAVAGQVTGSRCEAFDAAAFWRHALGTAIVSRGLARAGGLEEGQAFVAGLLHDIGLLAMSVYFPQPLAGLIAHARADDVELCAVERRHGLTPHGDVGAWIASHWRFPAPVVEAIKAHHAPVRGLSACVHVANAIVHALDVAALPHELVPAVDPAIWEQVAIDDAGLLALCDEAENGVRALCDALVL